MARPLIRRYARRVARSKGRGGPPCLAVAALVVLLAGCGNYVRRGAALYAEGHYVEAAEVFERTEHRLPLAPARECAEYGLYRGLTLLVLGDHASAHRWLTYAYQVERAVPGSLRGNRRALLDRGWQQLQDQPRSTPQPQPTPETALAASQPPPSTPTPQHSNESPVSPARRTLAPQ